MPFPIGTPVVAAIGEVAVLIPIVAIAMPMMIAIIAILTGHQRKMAEIYARNAQVQPNQDIVALRQEIRELKELVHQQAIALDSSVPPRVTPPANPLEQRLGNGGY